MKRKKYELDTDRPIQHFNTILFRIKALIDFDDVRVGDYGGYVESEKNLSHSGNCWIYDNSKVYGLGLLKDNAKTYNTAEVRCEATVLDDAKIYGESIISGQAKIYENATVSGKSQIFDKARVYGNAVIDGTSVTIYGPKVRVFDDAKVLGDAKILNNARIYGNATIKDCAIVKDKAEIYGSAIISGNAKVMNKAKVFTIPLPCYYETRTEISGTACIDKNIKIRELIMDSGLLK